MPALAVGDLVRRRQVPRSWVRQTSKAKIILQVGVVVAVRVTNSVGCMTPSTVLAKWTTATGKYLLVWHRPTDLVPAGQPGGSR